MDINRLISSQNRDQVNFVHVESCYQVKKYLSKPLIRMLSELNL